MSGRDPAAPRRGTIGGETFALMRRASPVQWIAPHLRPRVAAAIVAVAALLFPIVIRNDADIDSAANALSFAALALGLNIVVGFAGLLDLGYAAFFAIGAYTYGVAASWQLAPHWSGFWEPFQWLHLVSRFHDTGGDVVHFQVSFWLMMPISAALAALFGVLFGAPTLRLRGDYLAIVTLGFGEIVPIVARNWPTVTNGAMGLNGVAAPHLFGWSFGIDATPYYYVGLALVAFLILTSQRLKFSRIGRAWMAIREDEIAAAAMGVNRVKFKLLAFAIGAAFAGATGTLFVAKLQTATPEMFMFPVSVMILVMVVFGGIGSIWGVVVGALILQILQSWFLTDLSQWLHALGRLIGVEWLQRVELASSIELIFGLILVAMMLYRREGLIPATRAVQALSLAEQTAQVELAAPRAAERLRVLGDFDLSRPRPATRDQGFDRAVRRARRAALDGVDGAGEVGGRRDRAERLGQVDLVQCGHRARGAGRRHGALCRLPDRAVAAACCARPRDGPHLSEHPPLPELDRARKRHGRDARAAPHRCVWRADAAARNAARGGGGARALP